MLTYLNIGKMGRLANAMFEIAGTIGTAVKSYQSYAFPIFKNYDAQRLGSKEDIDVYKHFVNQLPELPPNVDFQEHGYFWGYDPNLQFPVGNWNLNGHFQSAKYFDFCMDLIHHYFTMVDEPAPIDAVAIHVRRGDYDGAFHPLQQKMYYQMALGHMPPSEILLFSDDMPEAIKIMENIGVTYTPVEKDTMESFKIMKQCKHFICANSSYSLMASILGRQRGKRIVCPSDWFGPSWGTELVRRDMAKDIYPEGSIII